MRKVVPAHRAILVQIIRCSIVGVIVAVLLVLSLDHPAYAKSFSGPKGPNYAANYCLKPQLTVYVTGPNSVYIYADIFNNCPANVAGSFSVGIKVTDCGGSVTPPSSANITFQVGTNGIPFSDELEGNAGCADCVNGAPVGFPPFHLQVNEGNIAGAYVYKNVAYRAYGNPSSASETELLSNNPPEYIPPCP
jgi:hypothetical protein